MLSKLGWRTGRGKRRSQARVGYVRKKYRVDPPNETTGDDGILNLAPATQDSGVSDTTLLKLIKETILAAEQIAPYARVVEVDIPGLGIRLRGRNDRSGNASPKTGSSEDLQRWTPLSPKRYEVMVHGAEDEVTHRIGFRRLVVDGSRILLNGKPFTFSEFGAGARYGFWDPDLESFPRIFKSRIMEPRSRWRSKCRA